MRILIVIELTGIGIVWTIVELVQHSIAVFVVGCWRARAHHEKQAEHSRPELPSSRRQARFRR
jgi:hypothetical protein